MTCELWFVRPSLTIYGLIDQQLKCGTRVYKFPDSSKNYFWKKSRFSRMQTAAWKCTREIHDFISSHDCNALLYFFFGIHSNEIRACKKSKSCKSENSSSNFVVSCPRSGEECRDVLMTLLTPIFLFPHNYRD